MKISLKALSLAFLLLAISATYSEQVAAQSFCFISITASEGGTTIPKPDNYWVSEGDSLVITALSDNGYRFTGWTIDENNATDNATLRMDVFASHNITAQFEREPCNLTVLADTGGTVSLPLGVHSYSYGTQVNITSSPAVEFRFANWIVDGQNVTGNPLFVNMTSNHVVRAVFSLKIQRLVIAQSTGGNVDGYNESAYHFTYGTQLKLTAAPSTGYSFLNWLLDNATETQNPLSITMDQDHELQANFQEMPAPTPSPTLVPTATPSPTPVPTPTPPLPTPTPIASPFASPTPTMTPTPTLTPTAQPTPAPATPQPSPTPTATTMPIQSPASTETPSLTVSPSPTPTQPTSDFETQPSGMNLSVPAAGATAAIFATIGAIIINKRRRPGYTVIE